MFSSLAGCDCDVVCDDGCDVTTAQGARDRDIIIIPDMRQERPEAGRVQSDQKSPFKFRLINIFWAEKNDSEIFLNLNDYLQK